MSNIYPMRGALERELGISTRLLDAARRIGVSPSQAKDFAVWFATLSEDERASLVNAAAKLPRKARGR